jgi:hypothetical protein
MGRAAFSVDITARAAFRQWAMARSGSWARASSIAATGSPKKLAVSSPARSRSVRLMGSVVETGTPRQSVRDMGALLSSLLAIELGCNGSTHQA